MENRFVGVMVKRSRRFVNVVNMRLRGFIDVVVHKRLRRSVDLAGKF